MSPLDCMPPKRQPFEALPTRQARASVRRAIGKLRHQVLSKATELRYKECFKNFRQFHHLQENFQVTEFHDFDEMVSEYIEVLWESGDVKSLANYTLAAIQYFRPQCKGHLVVMAAD